MSTTTLRRVRIQFAAAVWLLESFRRGQIAVSEQGIRKALWRFELAEIVLLTQSLSMIPLPNDDLDKEIAWSFTPPPDNWIAPSSWVIPPEYIQAARDILCTTFPDSYGMPATAAGRTVRRTVKPEHVKSFYSSQSHAQTTPSIAFSIPQPASDSPSNYAQTLSSIHPLLIQLHNLNLLAHQQLTHALEANNEALSTSRRLLGDVDAMLALYRAGGTFSS